MKPWRSTFLTNATIFAAGLIGGVISARFLGAEDRGLLAAIIYWPHFIAGIAAMGLNEGIVIRTARSGSSSTIRATAIAVSIILAVPLCILGCIVTPLLLGVGREEYIRFTQIYLVAFLPSTFIAQNLLAIDQGEFQFNKFNFHRIVQAVIYPLLLLGLWCFDIMNVEYAAVAVLAGTIVVGINRVWHARAGLLARPSLQEGLQLLIQSFRLHIVNIIVSTSLQVDKMMLVIFSTNTQLGVYTVAATAAAAAPSLLVQTYINIMLPSAAKVGINPETINQIIVPLRRLITLIVFSTVLLVLLLPYLIPIFFGNEFRSAGVYSQILTIAFAFVSLKKVMVYLMRSWNSNRPAVIGECLAAFILLGGAYGAVNWYGPLGLCVLVLVAHAASVCIIGNYFLKEAHLSFRQLIRG